jgi:hypothetical protein
MALTNRKLQTDWSAAPLDAIHVLSLYSHVSFPTAKFPSSAAFDAINDALSASEADRKDAIKKGGAVFAFTLKNTSGETDSWHIDLKNKGVVAKGLGEKPTGKDIFPVIPATPATVPAL